MRNPFNQFRIIFLLLFLLTGCVRFENIPDEPLLDEGKGIIVFRVNQPSGVWELDVEHYGGSKFWKIMKAGLIGPIRAFRLKEGPQIKAGWHLYVFTLPAGEYTWSQAKVGIGVVTLINRNRFEVESRKINYVGDLIVSKEDDHLGFQFQNNQEAVFEDLTTEYPNLLKAYPIVGHPTQIVNNH